MAEYIEREAVIKRLLCMTYPEAVNIVIQEPVKEADGNGNMV